MFSDVLAMCCASMLNHTYRMYVDDVYLPTTSQVIAATNRPDVLDPALLRSGRLDRKIELPHPSEEARARILQIHSRKMNVNKVCSIP
jgi:ATP-dependent 26S proteasome regulatory subunit